MVTITGRAQSRCVALRVRYSFNRGNKKITIQSFNILLSFNVPRRKLPMFSSTVALPVVFKVTSKIARTLFRFIWVVCINTQANGNNHFCCVENEGLAKQQS